MMKRCTEEKRILGGSTGKGPEVRSILPCCLFVYSQALDKCFSCMWAMHVALCTLSFTNKPVLILHCRCNIPHGTLQCYSIIQLMPGSIVKAHH